MKNEFLIFGDSVLAEVLYETIQQDDADRYSIVGFVVDDAFFSNANFCGKRVYKYSEIKNYFDQNNIEILPAVGYKNLNEFRCVLCCKLERDGWLIGNYINRRAIVRAERIGKGNLIFDGVNIGLKTVIGNGNIFYPNSLLAHHSIVGNFNFFAINSSIAGYVKIGDRCFFGNNSTTKDHISVGSMVLLGAGQYLSGKYDELQRLKDETMQEFKCCMEDILNKNNRNINGFECPIKVSTPEEYVPVVKNYLEKYISEVKRDAFRNDEGLVDTVELVCQTINDILDSKEFFDRANGNEYTKKDLCSLKKLIKGFINNEFLVNELNRNYALRGSTHNYEKELLLFRVRAGNFYQKEELYCCPLNKFKPGREGRFQMIGEPCLYLSATSWCSINEICPNGPFSIVGYRPNDLGKNLKILNFAVSQNLINGLSGEADKEKQSNLMKIFPLVIATSVTVEKQGEKYKPEYIISQILMECLKGLDLDGVAYLSAKGEDSFQYPYGVNVALLAKNEGKYEDVMDAFYVTSPLNLDEKVETFISTTFSDEFNAIKDGRKYKYLMLDNMLEFKEKIQIFYFGYSIKMLHTLLKSSLFVIVGVVSQTGKYASEFKDVCDENKLLFYEVADKDEIRLLCKRLRIKRVIMYEFGIIIPEDVCKDVRIVNFHPGNLLTNRGANPISWSVLLPELNAEMCAYRITGEIDCGYVISAHKSKVIKEDTPLTVKARLELFMDDMLKNVKKYFYYDNDDLYSYISGGTYRRRISAKDYTIDLQKDSKDTICRKIHSQIPYKGAIVSIKGIERRALEYREKTNGAYILLDNGEEIAL